VSYLADQDLDRRPGLPAGHYVLRDAITMRYLLLALTVSCAAVDRSGGEEMGESDVVAAVISACPTGQWCVETPPVDATAPPLLHAVFVVDASDVFAVGDNGTILRRIDDDWTVMPSPTTSNLRGLWAASSSDVWAVGVAGKVLHFNGTAWSTQVLPIYI